MTKFHLSYENNNPDVSDIKGHYSTRNEIRVMRMFPSLKEIHFSTREIEEEKYENLRSKYPSLAIEGKAEFASASTYIQTISEYGLTVKEWQGNPPVETWLKEYHPVLAKIETPDGVKFFAGFQPDYD